MLRAEVSRADAGTVAVAIRCHDLVELSIAPVRSTSNAPLCIRVTLGRAAQRSSAVKMVIGDSPSACFGNEVGGGKAKNTA